MALPALKHDVRVVDGTLPVTALRRWLRGNWALLFSHADDFASYGFEADRWLAYVREACSAAGVRPLALASTDSAHGGWPKQVGGSVADLRTSGTRAYPIACGTNEHALFTAIRNATTRFVMILDDSLSLRSTFTYTIQNRLPSPIDLVAMAATVRRAGGGREASSI